MSALMIVFCQCQNLQDLLVHGHGLWVGPDCDGLLNLCDESAPLGDLWEINQVET